MQIKGEQLIAAKGTKQRGKKRKCFKTGLKHKNTDIIIYIYIYNYVLSTFTKDNYYCCCCIILLLLFIILGYIKQRATHGILAGDLM